MKWILSFYILVVLFLRTEELRAQDDTFWQDSIRRGATEAATLRRSLRAMFAVDVDRGTLTTGLAVANNALSLSPGDPELTLMRARILYDLDRLDETVQALRTLIHTDPLGPFSLEAALVLGVALTRLDQFEEAAAVYRFFLAHAIWPHQRAMVLTNYAETQMALSRLERAEVAFRQALMEDGQYALAYFGLAVVLDRLGEQGQALEEMLHGLSMGRGIAELDSPGLFYVPDWEIHYYRALAYEALGQHERARTQWQAFLDGGGAGGPYAESVRAHLTRIE